MNKDPELLRGVSKFFTEELLREILRKASGRNKAELVGWTFQARTAKGDSFLSHVDKVTLCGTDGEEQIQAHLFVKSLPNNLSRRKSFRSSEFFYNEVTFYEKILPAFREFLLPKGMTHLLSVPEAFGSCSDGENDFVALQDLSILGYGPLTRLSTLTLEEMSLLIRAMADFHSVSFALRDQHPEEYENLAQQLKESYIGEQHWDWHKNIRVILMRIAKDALEKEYPGHPALEKFNSLSAKELFDRCSALASRTLEPTSVINQGDTWAPNFLVQSEEVQSRALLLDFQLARSASPVLDLSFLIYSCSDERLLEEHFDEMLRIYHEALSERISRLGSLPEKLYPWSKFMEEVKEQSIVGVNFALEAVPFALVEENEAYDLDSLFEGDEAVDTASIFHDLPNIKTREGRRRLAGLIVHAYSRGFI